MSYQSIRKAIVLVWTFVCLLRPLYILIHSPDLYETDFTDIYQEDST